ncbi:MAG: hypothetical protein QOK10_1292 [Pseudonocardiales bacterium]|nr:hypothetical protein [Pseudonocardiales bacterium]
MSAADRDEPVFAAPWEAQAFAMTLALHERGVFSWQEWTACLGEAITRDDRSYYEHWLDALEALIIEHGRCDADELDRHRAGWRRAIARTPHGSPITLTATDLGI